LIELALALALALALEFGFVMIYNNPGAPKKARGPLPPITKI
jgi:hypothetical protein